MARPLDFPRPSLPRSRPGAASAARPSGRSAFLGLVPFALWVIGGLAASGCTNCPVNGSEPVRVDTGRRLSPNVYESSPPRSAWLPFPSGTVYDFPHGLGDVPTVVNTYVSFDRTPLDGEGNGPDRPDHVSESAGNQTVIERWDAEVVRVRNDTCADFYLRVVVSASDATGLGGAGGSF